MGKDYNSMQDVHDEARHEWLSERECEEKNDVYYGQFALPEDDA